MTRRLILRAVAVAAVVFLAGESGYAAFGSNSVPTYTVQWGDTLWGISHRFGVNMDQLAAINGMQVNDLLLAGRTLVLPTTTATAMAVTTPATTETEPDGDSDDPATSTAASQAALSQDDLSAAGASSTAGAVGPALPSAAQLSQQQAFCTNFAPTPGPAGQLPSLLLASPDRLSLRPIFVQWAAANGIPASLAEAIAWQESGWQQNVVSSAGAVGIGQLMPGTADFIRLDLIGDPSLVSTDPVDNIRMSARLLGYLYQATGGNLCQTVAGYYEGLRNVRLVGVIPDAQQYVADVLSLLPRFQ